LPRPPRSDLGDLLTLTPSGCDARQGGAGTDLLFLGDGPIRLDIDQGRESGHEGDAFNGVERFAGTSGDDVVLGSPDAEEYVDLGGRDRVDLGAGDDRVTVAGPGTILTGPGNDDVTLSNAGSPTVDLGSGDDHVQVGWSSPVVRGGPGTDLIDFLFDLQGVSFDLAAGSVDRGAFGQFQALGFENTDGSPGGDVIYGNDGPNQLNGGNGNDTIDGRGGVDVCTGEVLVNC
jgi:hypothetical protein